jgi:uncharacterized protein
MPKLKDVTIEVQVQPKSSRNEIGGFQDGKIRVKVTSAPEGGKANESLREIISKALGVSKSSVRIIRGETSRLKILRILGVSQDKFDSFIKGFF